jgi:hypothetical protein
MREGKTIGTVRDRLASFVGVCLHPISTRVVAAVRDETAARRSGVAIASLNGLKRNSPRFRGLAVRRGTMDVTRRDLLRVTAAAAPGTALGGLVTVGLAPAVARAQELRINTASLGSVARVWLSAWGLLLLVGVVILGPGAPRPSQRPRSLGPDCSSVVAVVLVLGGGFVLRAVIVLSSYGLGI